MDRLVCEIRRQINKRRWKKWKAKQNKVREKTYFHCWNEVPLVWESSDFGTVEGQYTKAYSSVAIRITKGSWLWGSNKWLYEGYICGGGAARRTWEPAGSYGWGCAFDTIEITEKENKENFFFDLVRNNLERKGCMPHEGQDYWLSA